MSWWNIGLWELLNAASPALQQEMSVFDLSDEDRILEEDRAAACKVGDLHSAPYKIRNPSQPQNAPQNTPEILSRNPSRTKEDKYWSAANGGLRDGG